MIFNHLIDSLIGDTIHLKVFQILMQNGQGLTGRTLGKLANCSSFKINQTLRFLSNHGIVNHTVVGRAHLYRLNDKHFFVSNILNYLDVFKKNLPSYLGKNIIKQLSPRPLSIILYGSTARGEESADSDIDLLFIYKTLKKHNGEDEDGKIIEWIGQHFGKPASIKRMLLTSFIKPSKASQSFVRNIIKEGQLLSGTPITELLSHHG